jgi:hypothetical protein
MKVFDCQDMPDAVMKVFFEETEGEGNRYNDIYVSWDISGDWRDCDGDTPSEKLIDDWLFANGANREDKKVIVKRWW